MKKVRTYIVSILIALGVGGLSALITRGNMMLYEDIVKPPAAPPGFLFPIVWTILYILMGIGSARIYLKRDTMKKESRNALIVYGAQLAVNFLWSIIFFNFRAYLFAFI